MAGFERERDEHVTEEAQPRRADGRLTDNSLVSHIVALQQSAGNAAVSRLIARQRMLQRQGVGGGASGSSVPQSPAPASPPAAGGNDALFAMTRVAWQTGVTQREKDAAAILHRPKAGKPEILQAATQLNEAEQAADSIGEQLGTLDPNRVTRKNVHYNAIAAEISQMKPLAMTVTPADVGTDIESGLVPNSERTIADLTAPLPPATPGAGPGPPSAPAPPPPGQ